MQVARRFASAAASIAALTSGGCVRQGAGPRSPAASPPVATESARTTAPQITSALDVHEQVAARVLGGLRDHDFDAVERQFDAAMREAVPKEKVSRVWSSAVADQGELISWTLIRRKNHDGYDELLFALKHENGEFDALITFAQQGNEVIGLLLRPKGSL